MSSAPPTNPAAERAAPARATRIGLPIDRIRVDYHRISKTYPEKGEGPRAGWKYFYWNYTEHLTIDRILGTIELSQEADVDCTVVHTYRMREKVEALLDQFGTENLFFARYPLNARGEEEPDREENRFEDPDNKITYLIEIHYQRGPDRLLSGPYDKEGLPADFPDFIRPIFSLIQHYGAGEMIFPSVYGKRPHKKGDLIYCSVSFEEDGDTYYYITEDASITRGDYVVVPAGRDNRLTIVKVVKVEYFAPEKAPFPLERTKRVLRRCTEEELAQLEAE